MRYGTRTSKIFPVFFGRSGGRLFGGKRNSEFFEGSAEVQRRIGRWWFMLWKTRKHREIPQINEGFPVGFLENIFLKNPVFMVCLWWLSLLRGLLQSFRWKCYAGPISLRCATSTLTVGSVGLRLRLALKNRRAFRKVLLKLRYLQANHDGDCFSLQLHSIFGPIIFFLGLLFERTLLSWSV